MARLLQVPGADVATGDVRRLAHDLEQAEGAPPLSDQALGRLTSDAVTHWVARDGAELLGYAELDGDDAEVAGRSPASDILLDAVSAPGRRVWSHGHGSRLVPVLERRGWQRVRELHQLRRPLAALPADPSLSALPAEASLSAEVTIRAFIPGRDEQAWLAVNAAAFAHHPEQGRMTRADLDARMSEPWFDPSGFLLAERAGELLGFHWTKIHDNGTGEVYVLGVAPQAQGLGLGNGLLTRGLRHLQERGCPTALLYVEGDNAAALHLYERAGFTRFDLDIQWQLP